MEPQRLTCTTTEPCRTNASRTSSDPPTRSPPPHRNTVQHQIESRQFGLLRRPVRVEAWWGRTDTSVQATGAVVSVDLHEEEVTRFASAMMAGMTKKGRMVGRASQHKFMNDRSYGSFLFLGPGRSPERHAGRARISAVQTKVRFGPPLF